MTEAFSGWAIVELMGHRKLAGYVSERTIAGAAMLRLDVPSAPPATQFYGGSAIYCITPTTEELARRIAAQSRPTPVSQYELPEPPPSRTRRSFSSGDDCHRAEQDTTPSCGARGQPIAEGEPTADVVSDDGEIIELWHEHCAAADAEPSDGATNSAEGGW